MKTCDLKEVIYLPSGIFTHTTAKTCILSFIKKKEGSEALELKIENSKAHDKTSRIYKFTKDHQTSKVKFYDYNFKSNNKMLLVKTDIGMISTNSYSLNYLD